MNQLDHIQYIQESNLNQGLYFQSLFGEACRKHLLEDDQIKKVQLELLELLAKQVDRYTNGESSSVPVEIAQQLLESITNMMGVYMKTVPDMVQKLELLKQEKVSVLFYRGMDEVASLIKKAKLLLQNLQENSLKVENYAYHDTIYNGIPLFFHDYNMEYASHENVGSIDYPLCNTITDLSGIEYQYEYLKRLTIENNFLRKFDDFTLREILKNFSKDSEQLLINIFELTLTNAVGCIMVEKNYGDLLLYKTDLAFLQKSLAKLSPKEGQSKLEAAFDHLGKELNLDHATDNYARQALSEIFRRLEHNVKTDTLGQLFITFQNEKMNTASEYASGVSMSDKELRKLIIEMMECSNLPDKVKLLRERVRSLEDFMELLEECFYENDYDEVYKLLNVTEMNILSGHINSRLEGASFGNGDLKDWELHFYNMKRVVDSINEGKSDYKV